jgi:DNA-binding response OmpR family regulator
MLTAMTGELEKKQALEVGADDVWSKPFDMDLLRQRIEDLLTGNGRRKQ